MLPSTMPYSPNQYLSGLCRLPPNIASKQQKTYVYGGDVLVNNSSSARLDIGLDADSDFLVESIQITSGLMTTSQDLLTVQVTDTTYSQPWSNVAVPIRDIAGMGSITHELKYPNMMAPTGTVSLNFTNNSGTNTQVYVALSGRKFYGLTPDERAFLKRRMWYQYVMQVPSLVASSSGTQVNLQLFNESDFLLSDMLSVQGWAAIMAGSGGAVSNEIKCNFRDTSADRNFFSQNLAFRLVVGSYFALQVSGGTYVPFTSNQNGQQRFVKPMFIRRNGMIQGTFDNLATSTPAAFSLIFEGARVFDASN